MTQENNQIQAEEIPPLSSTQEDVDRGIPSPHAPKKGNNVNKLALAAVIVVAIGLAAGAGMLFVKNLEKEHERKTLDEQTNKKKDIETGKVKDFGKEKSEIASATEAELPMPSDASGVEAIAVEDGKPGNTANQSAAQPAPAPAGASGQQQQAGGQVQQTPRQRRMAGSVMVEIDKGSSGQASNGGNVQQASLISGNGSNGNKNSLENSLTPSRFADGVAARRPDLTHLLRRGTMIPCGLRTKIVTTYSGITSCIVSKDVYSADGRLLLIERGSEISGEQRGAITLGQARIFVLWSRIETPKGISVDIDSGGADSLGASGHEAWVDTHFWERFGGAILLSVINDVFGTIDNISKTSGSNSNQVSYQNTTQATNDMATEALKATINIPPTAYANQGGAITIMVARDVDFRGVYELARTK